MCYYWLWYWYWPEEQLPDVAHFDENTLAEIAKETEDKYWTFDKAFAENLYQYNTGFEDGKKYILNLLEKKGIKINLELLEN